MKKSIWNLESISQPIDVIVATKAPILGVFTWFYRVLLGYGYGHRTTIVPPPSDLREGG